MGKVSILLRLDTGWKKTLAPLFAERVSLVSILLRLDTGWKEYVKGLPQMTTASFNPLTSGYGLEAFAELPDCTVVQVSILLRLDTGWKIDVFQR